MNIHYDSSLVPHPHFSQYHPIFLWTIFPLHSGHLCSIPKYHASSSTLAILLELSFLRFDTLYLGQYDSCKRFGNDNYTNTCILED